jgi:hypothetical protein
VTYQHHLGAEVKAKKLSNAQLETVLYSMMRFNQELPSGAWWCMLIDQLQRGTSALTPLYRTDVPTALGHPRVSPAHTCSSSFFELACKVFPASIAMTITIVLPLFPQVSAPASSWVMELAWVKAGRLRPSSRCDEGLQDHDQGRYKENK